ncbi:hypothetical protein A8C46_00305 [Ligilactobacillus salivarius]|uniref:hypothetical protein n=1 Tax=Ligilactobacillus salivarius TaxID=1624 RepID=UPI000A2E5035|nr:hypothetical protein [Ligilactobacillus salivarius]OTF89761.1 hypothetical protein A8C38_00335 [Ligilactobacillus salivarius]PAY43595.1 hypothetical protein A8C39_00515 [Ligilactobacillus salivarius]PAY49409.1 hypothetical protein A8C42_00660 [Ligilactobacillus salivarius]PAY53212.1 hypothetical protein A8C41_08545 [Ligilactobacillus salivarius]PAY58045.1 hypothetical protein A8C46_00305 [Ligilactobacillus salivarius]
MFAMLIFSCFLYFVFMPLCFSAMILTGNLQGILIYYIWAIMMPIISMIMGGVFFLISEILEGYLTKLGTTLASILVIMWYTVIPYYLCRLTLCYPTWWMCVIWWIWGATPTIMTFKTEV